MNLSLRVRLSALLVAPTVLLVACSGGEKIVGASGTPVNNTTSLSSSDSTYLAGFVGAAAWTLMKQLRTITNMQIMGFGSSRPSCTPASVTGTADANSNGIPDDQITQYTAVGCSFLSGGASNTVAGSIRLQDLGGLYGYRVTYTNYAITATKGDSVTTATANGSYEFRYATTTSGSAVDNTTVVLRTQSSAGSITLTRSASITGTSAPTSGAFSFNTFPGATMSLGGNLTIAFVLTGNAIQSGYPSSVTFSMGLSTPTALTSPNTCAATPAFTAGAINGSISGTWTGALRVAYAACGTGVGENPGKR